MSAPSLSPFELPLARHALGLPNRHRASYRNRYITTLGTIEHEAWLSMTAAGTAAQDSRYERLFRLTPAGAVLALADGERLCPEDFPPA